MAERTIVVQPGQTMEDIALQEYGTVDAVVYLLMDNRDAFPNGFSSTIQAGLTLVIPREPEDPTMVNTMRNLGIIPSTGDIPDGPVIGTGPDHNGDFNNDHG